jgi:hypothetical protein
VLRVYEIYRRKNQGETNNDWRPDLDKFWQRAFGWSQNKQSTERTDCGSTEVPAN